MGLSRIVEIDTTGGPGFGFEHFKQYDFLRAKEVVLTFDDGPWPDNTPAVLKALADKCLKATFFAIGEHATWHPEILKQVVAAGNTIGSHTWSHKDLARNPYATTSTGQGGDRDGHERRACGGRRADRAVLPLSGAAAPAGDADLPGRAQHRDLLDRHRLLRLQDAQAGGGDQLGDDQAGEERQGHHPDARLPARHRRGAARVLRQLKADGYKIVHMVPKEPVTTLPKYDEMVTQQDKLSANNTRPERQRGAHDRRVYRGRAAARRGER